MNTSQQIILLMIKKETDRQLLRELLEDSGYVVKIASDTFLTVEWLESSSIITDEIYACRFSKELINIKLQSGPLFLPLIILLPQNKDSSAWLESSFDEVLRLPLLKNEVIPKLHALSRIRAKSEEQHRLQFEQLHSAEDALKLSEEKYRDLIECLPYGLLIQSRNKIVFVNIAMVKMLNDKEGTQLIGKPLINRVHPDEQASFMEKLQYVKDKNKATDIAKQKFVTVDGQIIDVEVMVCPVIFEGSSAVQLIVHDITARVRAEERVKYMAHHDPLTGLINRAKLEIAINQLLKIAEWQTKQVAVVHMGLNQFGVVNDAHGHVWGDKLLCEVAARLKKSTRKADIVARLGGDEFIIVITDIEDARRVAQIVSMKIMKIISIPFTLNHHKLHITASMGISVYPTDGSDAAMLIKNANIAKSYAKESGGNSFKFCTPAMATYTQQNVSLVENIHEGIANNEFSVYFQPIMKIKTEKMVGVEALLRWQHPTDGNVPPNVFIPLVEKMGLIGAMTNKLFTEVCQQIKNWQAHNLPPIEIAVNLSARCFANPDFINEIVSIMKQYDVNPRLITIEITESVLFQDIENRTNAAMKLKDLGMKISIDDFGTGYSSLNYLRHFIIDSIKIDLSFIRDLTIDPEDALIVKTIISMAHNLNIKVIAEGVETREQLQLLKDYHCDEAQGFYFYKALPECELIKLMGL